MKKYLNLSTLLIATLTLQSNTTFAFGISAKGIFQYGQPVHELITTKAAQESGYLTANESNQLKQLIEGVRFNDDPESYLSRGDVLGFASEFMASRKDEQHNDPTKASHFGNYQFLHGMAKAGTPAYKVQNHMMLYAYLCWLSATNANSFENLKVLYSTVTEKTANQAPHSQYSREELILKEMISIFPREVIFFNSDNQNDFQSRALGSLLHMIQDSYAKGHTVRAGWEDGSNSGAIKYFQDYQQQNSKHHDFHDTHEYGRLDENNIFEIGGSKIALERSKQILDMVSKKCPWSSAGLTATPQCTQSVRSFLENDVFNLDTTINPEEKATHSHIELTAPRRQNVDTSLSAGG